MILSEDRFLLARSRLSLLVQEKAVGLTDAYGITWAATDDAPDDLPAVTEAWVRARRSRGVFPVWAGASDNTIYLRPVDNHAFRFWHDSLHVRYARGMSLADELAISSMHVNHVADRYGKDSPEAALMAVDTAGQALYYMAHGEHVPNQLEFARARFGLGVS